MNKYSVETVEVSRTKLILSVIFCIILGVAILQSEIIFPKAKSDADCLEWGVEVQYSDGTKDWAKIYKIPRNREEAEDIAKQLEEQDRSGRYYEAKCKKWKGD
jgi:hypothetical protein